MYLIATDEAGYGPKLGPLVIVATVWKVPVESIDLAMLRRVFSPLSHPLACGGQTVVVDDSKAIYQRSAGLDGLHAAVSASQHWCGRRSSTVAQWLRRVAADDVDQLERTPWLSLCDEVEWLPQSDTGPLVDTWKSTGLELLDVFARVITARTFNQYCERGYNKADLLSETTLRLTETALANCSAPERATDIAAPVTKTPDIAVFCDRHGGRRYYGGVLQHVFPDATVDRVKESKEESIYRVADGDQRCQFHFTVQGDSFTPVALASIHAKYLRERMMESFNHYFLTRHRGDLPLKTTAGYPVDAERYLEEIEPILERENIAPGTLIRCR